MSTLNPLYSNDYYSSICISIITILLFVFQLLLFLNLIIELSLIHSITILLQAKHYNTFQLFLHAALAESLEIAFVLASSQ